MLKLYFVRHGESIANLLHEFSNTGCKHPLTETGINQAKSLANHLSRLQITQIYSSPILRALQTAQILSDRLQAPLEIAPALQEWSVGIYEGTTDQIGWELHHQVQDDWFIHRKFDSKMPNGESFCEIQSRFNPFIERLVENGRYSDQNIVLVAHGGLYLAMLPSILKNISFAFARQNGFSHTAYTVAELRSDGLYCTSWGTVSLANQ
jgi:broad specificity phosphatase PhoE